MHHNKSKLKIKDTRVNQDIQKNPMRQFRESNNNDNNIMFKPRVPNAIKPYPFPSSEMICFPCPLKSLEYYVFR